MSSACPKGARHEKKQFLEEEKVVSAGNNDGAAGTASSIPFPPIRGVVLVPVLLLVVEAVTDQPGEMTGGLKEAHDDAQAIVVDGPALSLHSRGNEVDDS